MSTTTREPRYTLKLDTDTNGRVGMTTVRAVDENDKTLAHDCANLSKTTERRKVAKGIAEKLGVDWKELLKELDALYFETLDEHRRMREKAEAGSPEAAAQVKVELLDEQAEAIRRPLCLVGGHAYAAAWCSVRTQTSASTDDTGKTTYHEPPLVSVVQRQVIVTNEGKAFSDGGLRNAASLDDLGLPVELPHPLPPGKGWSGAGIKRYLAGQRPDPANVFGQLVKVVDRFLDFDRGMAPQTTLCELVACYVLASWLLDAFHVAGYLWPNGEAGSGKTTLLSVVAELGYLGQVILAGSSYAALRDLADYGAVLGFDDAEAVMDPKRTDPDKRTLLLAGNRRGNCIALKEKVAGDRWVTRHVHTFCPRLFSAIRLPDPVLGSRSIVVHLVRSADPQRTKANVLDYSTWPCDRRRLVDDCWALGLTHLPELSEHDGKAAELARLAGRDLEPWRAILAVAHWLQERHGVAGLFERLEELSTTYQENRQDFEAASLTRLLAWALRELMDDSEAINFTPADLAGRMNLIATREELSEEGEEATNARKVGWLLKRLRFTKDDRSEKAKRWKATRAEVEKLCCAYRVPEPAGDEAEADVF